MDPIIYNITPYEDDEIRPFQLWRLDFDILKYVEPISQIEADATIIS
jgi:hypothetical protein